ncbi:MAG TPA: PEP-CTERM sorting domain-containing protein [Cyanothece sp. UBA12306]|nr:PEP-CTERM sorting domain-containing protein [Cyanothece sp. UBA12306]
MASVTGGFVRLEEKRNGTVPEPLTMLGAGAAAAFGVSFKRKLAKSK